MAGIVAQIREIMAVDVEADGFVFDPASIQAERITEDADYEGIRIRFRGLLDTARVTLQIDIGFGDIVYPGPEESDLPAMLDFPAPRLPCYSRESAIAEKFEAIRSPTQGQERFPSSEENLDAIPEERGRGACEPKSPITERSERHRHSDPAGGKMHYPSGGRRPANHSLRYRSDQS